MIFKYSLRFFSQQSLITKTIIDKSDDFKTKAGELKEIKPKQQPKTITECIKIKNYKKLFRILFNKLNEFLVNAFDPGYEGANDCGIFDIESFLFDQEREKIKKL